MPSRRAAMAMRNDAKVGVFIVDGVDGLDAPFLGRVAAQMMDDPWWRTVPEYTQPEPVSGEIG